MSALGEAVRDGKAKQTMRALTLVSDRTMELREIAPPPPPGAGEVQIAIKAIGLNHIDVWGWRGMAFAKRAMPLIVGAEAAGRNSRGRSGCDIVQARRPRGAPMAG